MFRTNIAIAAAAAVVLSGCAAGRDPETAAPTQLVEGVNVSQGSIVVRNLFILGPERGKQLPAGASVPVYMSLINNGTAADKLTSLAAPGFAQTVQGPPQGIDIPSRKLVSVTTTTAPPAPSPSRKAKPGKTPEATEAPNGQSSEPTPTVVLQGISKGLWGGERATLQLTFAQAGTLTVRAPVVSRYSQYATYPPAPDIPEQSAAPKEPAPSPSS